MAHPDADRLALLALDDADLDPADVRQARAHVAGCATCAAELDSLERVVTAGRAGARQGLIAPPPGLWARVAAEADVPRGHAVAAPAEGAHRGDPIDGPPATNELRSPSGPGGPPPGAAADDRRSRRGLVAAAVVGLVVGAGVVAGIAVSTDDEPPTAQPPSDDLTDPPPTDTGRVVARADLEPLPRQRTAGSARVVSDDGGRRLEVRLGRLDRGTGYVQVWLYDPATLDMVTVGVLDSGWRESFAVPDGLDLGAYSGVDVSREPYDGDPGHSDTSLARGDLRRS